jgi:alanine racemase
VSAPGYQPPVTSPEPGRATRVAAWLRPAWVEVDRSALTANVSYLASAVSPARVCAVVKADGYGHGAVEVAKAAVAGGATYLGVALAEEGHQLRQAGITTQVLILSEPPAAAMELVVADGLTPTIYTDGGLAALLGAARGRPLVSMAGPAGAARSRPLQTPVPVHLKVDTGMHRVGADGETVVRLAKTVTARPELLLEGLFTHLAVADELGDPYTAQQLAAFDRVVGDLAEHDIRPALLHAANSAGGLFWPAARLDLVRTGIAMYGLAPAATLVPDPLVRRLRPVLSLKARVAYVKELDAGERLSYGLHYRLGQRSVIATVPLGYADGVPRRLSEVRGAVLIGGRRYPVAGAVTMDQIMIDCGPGAPVSAGDEVVLIGRQGGDEISAWEWAERLGTIAYEVTCALSARLPRTYL